MNYKVFACPNCKHYPLNLAIKVLECTNCRSKYFIRKDIPILIPDESLSVSIGGKERTLSAIQEIYDKAYTHDGLMGTDLDQNYDKTTKTILMEFAAPLSGKRILDVGTGVGNLWDYILDSVDGFALDPSFIGVSKAIQSHPGLTVSVSVGENIPYIDEFFDLVISADTVEHTFSPEKTLEEIYRVLKPEGIFSASFPIPDSLRKWGWNQLRQNRFSLTFFYRTLRVVLKRVLLFGKATFQPIDRDLDEHSWKDLLEESGFCIKQVTKWPKEPEVPIVYLVHAIKT